MKEANVPGYEYEVRKTDGVWELRVLPAGSCEGHFERRADAIALGRLLQTVKEGPLYIQNADKRTYTETELLTELWKESVCPYCDKSISEGSRVGTGKIERGVFCSLGCYANYYRNELLNRAGLLTPN